MHISLARIMITERSRRIFSALNFLILLPFPFPSCHEITPINDCSKKGGQDQRVKARMPLMRGPFLPCTLKEQSSRQTIDLSCTRVTTAGQGPASWTSKPQIIPAVTNCRKCLKNAGLRFCDPRRGDEFMKPKKNFVRTPPVPKVSIILLMA